ncbi:hypothetical protein HCN44_004043 [Aphidius gifuensis]|uniref:Histone acetyltransferase n=1 Tax=Aphidius gifuensis TaxID=684658 RepID=A0A834XXE0_APHGI|nr:hypothetical protein HCN44_004043 [Aphidius gifuensis]
MEIYKNDDGNIEEDKISMEKKIMTDFVNNHLKVVDLSKNICDIFSTVIFMQYVYSTFLICIPAYISSNAPFLSAEFFSQIMVLGLGSMQISIICYASNEMKNQTTSSESTTSSSSGSSSSSSSSSGSESSSSDSENSSSSVKSQKISDNEKTNKKKTSITTNRHNKSKNDTNTTDNKNDDNKTATNSRTLIYTSESEESQIKQKPVSKKKPPTKPKATATVAPVIKAQKPTGKTHPSSAQHKNALTSKLVHKNNKTSGNTNSGNINKTNDKTSKQNNDSNKKKLIKKKSIFSPENSSESLITRQIKSESSTSSKSDSGASGGGGSGSSESSESSSDSDSSDSSPSSQPPVKKKDNHTNNTNSRPSVAVAAVKPQKNTKRSVTTIKSEADESDSDRKDVKPINRTSSATSPKGKKKVQSKKINKLLQSQIKAETDTESDGGCVEIKRSTSRSPVKRVTNKNSTISTSVKSTGHGTSGSTSGKLLQNDKSRNKTTKALECPLAATCDSLGHLSGKLDTHFTLESCPIYHNTTPQACIDFYKERKKREEERRKAIICVGKKSPKGIHQTNEQRNYQLKVKEMRSKFKRSSADGGGGSDSGGERPGITKDRQPKLSCLTSDYDLKLFMEAQALARRNGGGTRCVEMGKWEMEVWYQSPYPEEFCRAPKLYLCEFCLRYAKSRQVLRRHRENVYGNIHQVMKKDKIGVWEVDGKRYKQYCQNLCLLAKFFLDHKTLYYDVEPFLFYVMTINDSEGCHTVGYFSKEKNSFLNYNVSCILTLPPYQRQGYGRLLIDFSYLLTRVEKKIGSPEKPLSDLGLISYRSYWKDVLLQYLCNFGGKELSVKDISKEMAIDSYDIVSTLQALGMMKYWKGKHIILKKQDVIDDYKERVKRRGPVYKEIDPDCLKWNPFQPPKTPATSN